jgi:hypothetical protein
LRVSMESPVENPAIRRTGMRPTINFDTGMATFRDDS